jgi:hypothetical protein
MSKKSTLPLVSAIFSAFMALVYIGLGIFYLTTDYGVMVERKIGTWPGYLLILFGLYRAFGAYQKIKSLKDNND